MTTRAAVYARISDDELGTEKGVTRQKEDAHALAAGRGWEVVAEYADNDISAFSGALRPDYQRLMEDAQAGAFDWIVVYQSSRIWRSRRERAEAIEVLQRCKVGVASVQGPDLDLRTSGGRMLAGLLGEFDTAESDIKSERVARSALQRAQEGRANGAVAYGWRREYERTASGQVASFRDVENPDEAAIVREIVTRLLSGDGIRGIADDLNRRGVPTPSRKAGVVWRHTTIRKLALRPANIAIRVYHGKEIGRADWPAIVREDDHHRVCALLNQPDRRMTRDSSRRHLLSYGIGECGVCGSVLRVSRKRQREREHVLYVCEAKGCVGRSVERVDALVSAVVVERLSRPDALSTLADGGEDAREATERAEALRARLDSAADQYADGEIDARQLARITERLRPEMQQAEDDARRARGRAGVAALEGLTGADAECQWDALDVSRRRAVLAALDIVVRIMPTAQGPGFRPDDVVITNRA